MTVADNLRAARALITDPAHHTTGHFARNARGDGCFADDPRAVSFCARGAILRVRGLPGHARQDTLLPEEEVLAETLGLGDDAHPHALGRWNNATPHPEILAVMDRAAALAEERGL